MNKQILIFLLLAVFSMTTMAQNKRIAILETIDKEDKVSYAIEVMVRSNLTKVISKAEGYEGYDRVNISEIMDEHDFERTGLVSEEQIRQLGAISGVDFILVSEVAKLDESNIIVTAKKLNVISAKIEGSENELMGTTPQEMQHGCESLANRLLGFPASVVQNDNSAKKAVMTEETTSDVASCMNDTDFEEILVLIKHESFESTRMTIAKQVVDANMFNVHQIIKICKLFSFDSNRLEFAKYAYKSCIEKDKYYLVYDVFSYTSFKEKLDKYIKQQQ